MKRRKTLSWALSAGILLTVSVSYASYALTGGGDQETITPGEIAVSTGDDYLGTLFRNLECEGIHHYGEDGLPQDFWQDGNQDGTMDDFTISFQSQPGTARTTIGYLANLYGDLATIDFVFTFSDASKVNAASLVNQCKAYYVYSLPSSPSADEVLPLSDWSVQDGSFAEGGTSVPCLRAAGNSLILSVLLTDHDLSGSNVQDPHPYFHSLIDVLSILSYSNQYQIVLDLDLSEDAGLTVADFEDVTLHVQVSSGPEGGLSQ